MTYRLCCSCSSLSFFLLWKIHHYCRKKNVSLKMCHCVWIFFLPLEWRIGHLFNWIHETDGPVRCFALLKLASLKIQFYFCSRRNDRETWLEQNENSRKKRETEFNKLIGQIFIQYIEWKHLQWHNRKHILAFLKLLSSMLLPFFAYLKQAKSW